MEHSHSSEGIASCHSSSHGGHSHNKKDFLYIISIAVIVLAYLGHLLTPYFSLQFDSEHLAHFCHNIFEMMNDMWWGVLIGILGVGFLNQIPREMVMRYFSRGPRIVGLFKATIAGTVFDLCNHGVLVLGMKIYERGASLGQTMAFLISSPWNSFSLTLILYALIGGKLTFLFMLLSMAIAIITGWIFDELVVRGVLPGHSTSQVVPQQISPFRFSFSWAYLFLIIKEGLRESKMIFKWIFFGVIISAVVGAFVSPEIFIEYFGNSTKGMLATLAAATGLEVCSEGFVPLAADLVRIAQAPGNAFIFLMAGVATDLTEILVIRQTMKSWKVALFLPLITVPQIMVFGWLINRGIL